MSSIDNSLSKGFSFVLTEEARFRLQIHSTAIMSVWKPKRLYAVKMTEIPNTVGKRIAYYRKELNLGSTADLAAAIGHPPITAAVLQNIESGRKADISISQLLNIAAALGISPLMLLTRADRPFESLDIPNLSDELKDVPAWQFDAWVSATGHQQMGLIGPLPALVHQMTFAEMRRFTKLLDRWREDEEDLDEMTPDEVKTHAELETRIATLYESLSKVLDLTWAVGPWQKKRGSDV
ncbi:helix-turn-helix domain-containing protein [Cryobacterium arcticum]|uniref:HTH cro/C1-type domain-containing protein n=1 Tax=Cryobacterium arcticum TaxID=670052 RepID=A0A317ZX58_9MICO|nr:helix-turn-helix transcriptional regulator [Cryobacterium arcticum]PXA71874.1 hypothetical protein CTB96_02835 [Cryobacterium arcticum]